MAAEKLGRRMDDQIGAPFEGAAQIGRGESVINNQRDSGVMGDRRHLLDINDDAAGVGEVLDKDRLCSRGERAAEILRLGRVDKMACPTKLLERQSELGQRAAIKIARGEEFVARLHQRKKYQELR